MNSRIDDDIEPEDEAEALRKRVAIRLKTTTATYAAWVADQVDGSLQDVIDAVLYEVNRTDAQSADAPEA